MKIIATTIVLTLAFVTGATAQPASAPDLAKGAVDPLEIGIQRARFMRAAGVDSELNKEEFDTDSGKPDGFARSFDKWEALARFDKNSNGTIDWLEANGYRDDLRERFLGTYDADRNGKLSGEERAKANEALAAGKIPAAVARPQAAPGGAPAPRPGGPFGGEGPGRFGGPQGEQFQQIQKQLIEKYDKDGDGELNREERRASSDEARQLFRDAFTKQYDTNGDGQVDDAERQKMFEQFRGQQEQFFQRRFDRDNDGQLNEAEKAEMEKSREEFRRRGEEGRQQFMKEFDKDGDGELSEAERQAIGETFRQRGEERRREMLKRFDADGDGDLNEQERDNARDTQRREFMEKYDADRDGQMSEEEWRKAREESGPGGLGGFGGPGGFGRGFGGFRGPRGGERQLQ